MKSLLQVDGVADVDIFGANRPEINIRIRKSALDATAFAALAAGNFAAVDAMAKLIGESEFSLLFHKGEKSSIHFSKANNETLLITMFNKNISLGLVRLKVAETIKKINAVLADG